MKPSPKMLIPISLVAALAVGGYFLDAARAAKRSQLSGTFESRPTLLSSRSGGRVIEFKVAEGEAVSAGQVIAVLDAPTAEAEADSKASLAEQAHQRALEVARGPRAEEIERQQAVVAQLQSQLQKLRNGPLPEEIRAAESRFRAAESQYNKALKGARPEELAAARAAEAQAKARLDAAMRGPTPQERAQFQAALDAALAQERNAKANRDRAQTLYEQGALSKQAADAAETAFRTAEAHRKQAAEALDRAQMGTPDEELRQAKEAHRQAQAARALVEAGPRAEDREASRQEMLSAKETWSLLKRGARAEDIRVAAAQVAQAEAVLRELKFGSRKEQIAQAQAAASAAKSGKKGSLAVAEDRLVRAPVDGVIERLLAARGDLVGAGTPVAVLSDPSDVWLRVYLPESDLAKVKVGDRAEIRVDGIGQSVEGRVETIATQGEYTPSNLQAPEERGKQVFAIRLRLVRPDPRVKAGMSASVKKVGDWH